MTTNRVVLVTGASRGFGRAIAIELAKGGDRVILNFRRSMTEVQGVYDEIHKLGGQAKIYRADMGDESKISGMMDVIRDEYGHLDSIIANASFGIPGPLLTTKSKAWDITMDATARSLLNLAQYGVPLMRQGGHIVSVSSYGHERILPGYGVVGVAKGAVATLTKALAVELAPKGIIVNGVLPGVSPTKSMMAIPGAAEALEMVTQQTPMGRLVTPEEVAKVVAFLVSGQANMIVGQQLIIDGGAILV